MRTAKKSAPVVRSPQFRERTTYHWKEWTDGKARTLSKGVHFFGPAKNFAVTAFQHARRNNMKVHVRIDKDTVLLQFEPPKRKK